MYSPKCQMNCSLEVGTCFLNCALSLKASSSNGMANSMQDKSLLLFLLPEHYPR